MKVVVYAAEQDLGVEVAEVIRFVTARHMVNIVWGACEGSRGES